MTPTSATIQLYCTACGHGFHQTMQALKSQPEMACPACHEVFKIDLTPAPEPLSNVDSVLADLDKVLSGFGRLRSR